MNQYVKVISGLMFKTACVVIACFVNFVKVVISWTF